MGAPQVIRGALPAALCARWLAAIAPHAGRSLALSQHPGLHAAEVLQAVAASALAAPARQALEPPLLCKLDQSWIRHGRPPHSWHQDGALGFDFMAHEHRDLPEGALLPMQTCWIALTPCGADAPGLEWVNAPTPQLLCPSELIDTAVQQRFAAQGFERPILQPGDAVVFDGSLLHRTHLRPAMTATRTSLELRYFRADAFQRQGGPADKAWRTASTAAS